MAAAEEHEGSGAYVLHHLTNLKLDLHTMALSTEAKGFWVLNLDSVVFSLVLGTVFLFVLLKAAATARAGKSSGLLNFVEMVIEFWQKQVLEVFPKADPLVVPLALTIFVSNEDSVRVEAEQGNEKMVQDLYRELKAKLEAL